MASKRKRNSATPETRLLLRAMKEYFNGKVRTKCDKCAGIIQFKELSQSAWEHSCTCGKYNGTLRGL